MITIPAATIISTGHLVARMRVAKSRELTPDIDSSADQRSLARNASGKPDGFGRMKIARVIDEFALHPGLQPNALFFYRKMPLVTGPNTVLSAKTCALVTD